MADNKKTGKSVNVETSDELIEEAVEKNSIKAEIAEEEAAEKADEKKKSECDKNTAEDEKSDACQTDKCNDKNVNNDDSLEKAKAKADEYLDKYQRLMAEFYNFRERTSKEKAGMYNDGLRDTVEKILPVIDNLERAVNAQRDKTQEDDAFFKGVDMILKQFKEIIKGMGVEEIPALGEKFDPKLHSAVSHIEDESFGENTVSVEMLKGYKIGEKVIRHSMVQVAN